MMPINISLSYYKRKDIQEEMLHCSANREVVAKFGESFGKRPDVLNYQKDILELAKIGATSFHTSEELWKNPLLLSPSLKKAEMDNLRIGWDLVLDIDCGIFEYSKIAADLIIKALKYHDIKSLSCKYSGNKGFHIGVPFDSFPDKINNIETRQLFPNAPRRIALYLKEFIKKPLQGKIMKLDTLPKILEKTKQDKSKIVYYEKNEFGERIPKLNIESFLNIDTILISSRHLYRMPYSLHEKSGLASIPVNPEKVMDFDKNDAKPENIRKNEFRFLNNENVMKGEAKRLIVEAFDFIGNKEESLDFNFKSFKASDSAINEEFFPPCVKLILNGLEDGRKRGLFILLNFLTSVGWDYADIEKLINSWNKKNKEPLREIYLQGQLRHHKQVNKKILPPNCNNSMYMIDIGVCKPDSLCQKIRNPATYSLRKGAFLKKEKKD